MVNITIKDLMSKKNISRYKLQQLTNWNYKRINALYFSRVKYITLEEIEKLSNILDCDIQDIVSIDR
ncbi:MAG: helix-turn-helix transcriptional regulator [Clostridia bacterium]|nr:helix-turn-helix transcriptional regulator [Clostridia bacterium]MBQ9298006.1 helix-turn-helix transcriptional regulator [Clostridia bacterium]